MKELYETLQFLHYMGQVLTRKAKAFKDRKWRNGEIVIKSKPQAHKEIIMH